jgi:asparagine synthetase B (glutamine-hydrolysing)
MNEVKDVIMANLSQIPEDEPVAVSLSAGIDSTSVFAALMELQRYVTVYSFTLNGWVSRDFAVARENARKVGAGFIPVFLPTDIDTLKADVHKLIGHYHLKKKADIE